MTYRIIWDQQSRGFLRKIEKNGSKRIIKKINSSIKLNNIIAKFIDKEESK